MRLLRRLVIDLAGYLAGCLAAGLLIAVALGAFGEGVGLEAALAIAGFAAAFAALPLAAAIVLAEVYRLRSILVWLLAGGATGLGALLVLHPFTPGISQKSPELFLLAGLVWGGVYWLIAGRGSGRR